MDLSAGQNVFTLFYAIFWGLLAATQPRWKAFNLPLFWKVPQVARRVLLSFSCLNVLPLIIFALILRAFVDTAISPGTGIAFFQPLFYVLPAFTVLGCYRLWLGCVELKPECFYLDDAERKKLQSPHDRLQRHDPIYWTGEAAEPPNKPYVAIGDAGSGWRNVLWALTYLVVGGTYPFVLAVCPNVKQLPLSPPEMTARAVLSRATTSVDNHDRIDIRLTSGVIISVGAEVKTDALRNVLEVLPPK